VPAPTFPDSPLSEAVTFVFVCPGFAALLEAILTSLSIVNLTPPDETITVLWGNEIWSVVQLNTVTSPFAGSPTFSTPVAVAFCEPASETAILRPEISDFSSSADPKTTSASISPSMLWLFAEITICADVMVFPKTKLAPRSTSTKITSPIAAFFKTGPFLKVSKKLGRYERVVTFFRILDIEDFGDGPVLALDISAISCLGTAYSSLSGDS